MSKRKIKIRYIVILPVLICALIFIRKLMKLNDLDAKEVASIRADGVKEPLYQWEHANMTSFSVGRILR